MSENLHLFLVEDDDDVALLMRKALERAGHRVTTCRAATDALIVLGTTPFDLMLLDHRLPDMAGAEMLQAMDREGLALPVLMVTAYGDEELATRVLRAGAVDYIVKDSGQHFLNELPKRVAESYTRYRLQHTNRLLIEALESAQDGIMITDVQGTIIHVNRALEELTGYSRHELLGCNPRILKSNTHGREVYEHLWHTILARSSWQGELTNRRKDGSNYEVSVSISPIVDTHGRLTHFVGIQRDITSVKQLQLQLMQAQKMQSIGTLAGGVAHEFNNILAGISGYATLGLRHCREDQPREFFQFIVDLSDRAASLTRQLLAFARRGSFQRQVLAAEEILHGTAGLLARTLRHELRLDIESAEDGTPLAVEGDINQLQQAVVNLVLNARDAMPDLGTIHLRLGHEVLLENRKTYPEMIPAGDYAVIEVADLGSGMTAEVLMRAFDPFFTTKEVGKGTGLGLPLVYGIIRGHNGYIEIQSQPDRGTRVCLYLPRLTHPAPLSEPAEIPVSEVLEPESGPHYRVLVIDDEPAVQQVVRGFLEAAGHQVTTASSASEGLQIFRRAPEVVDLVLLDWLMPREDGSVAFRQLRKLQPELPILILTGFMPDKLAQQLLNQGATGIIRKPFRMNELWYAVNQALNTPVAAGTGTSKGSVGAGNKGDPT